MNDPIRQAFEDITYATLNISGTKTGHGLRRKENGEYVSDLLEDHWNTFQEGWECAVRETLTQMAIQMDKFGDNQANNPVWYKSEEAVKKQFGFE